VTLASPPAFSSEPHFCVFSFPLSFFRPTEIPTDFPRRLITPRCTSHKTLFNLNQRERVYYTCWYESSTDTPLSLSLSIFLSLSISFFEFYDVTKDAKTWEYLLILCNATLINSRRFSDVHAIEIRHNPGVYLALKRFARLINNKHRE